MNVQNRLSPEFLKLKGVNGPEELQFIIDRTKNLNSQTKSFFN